MNRLLRDGPMDGLVSSAAAQLSRRRTAAPLPGRDHQPRRVWLYFRFHPELRDVEELLAERGVQRQL